MTTEFERNFKWRLARLVSRYWTCRSRQSVLDSILAFSEETDGEVKDMLRMRKEGRRSEHGGY